MRFVNLTPHKVKVIVAEKTGIVYESAGSPIYLGREFRDIYVGEVTISQCIYSVDASALPPPKDCTWYIVPKIVRDAFRDKRNDLISPGTNPGVDGAIVKNGKIVSVRRFRLPDKFVFSDENEN